MLIFFGKVGGMSTGCIVSAKTFSSKRFAHNNLALTVQPAEKKPFVKCDFGNFSLSKNKLCGKLKINSKK